jgi:hypothetical protein
MINIVLSFNCLVFFAMMCLFFRESRKLKWSNLTIMCFHDEDVKNTQFSTEDVANIK